MTDGTQPGRGNVPLKSFIKDFRSGLNDHDLREKYGLTARGFVALIKALLAKKVINEEDLKKRREIGVQRDLAKESQFLSGLFLCPYCSHPHPKPFLVCPACGADLAQGNETSPSSNSSISSGAQLYFNENHATVESCERDAKGLETAPSNDYPSTELIAVQQGEFPTTEVEILEEREGEAPKKGRLARIKSALSKLKRK